jgi:hypothetical protein
MSVAVVVVAAVVLDVIFVVLSQGNIDDNHCIRIS